MLASIFGRSPYQKKPLKKRDLVPIQIDQLRPTQFSLGLEEVKHRKKKIAEYLPKGSEVLKTYLQDEFGRVVLGPENHLYLIDGHHHARALQEMGLAEMYVVIEKDWSDRKEKKFWKRMKNKEMLFLRDEEGNKRDYEELPATIGLLKDDPYRSLAWMVKKIGVYKESEQPFQEFHWALFFRDEIKLPPRPTANDFRGAAEVAIELARKKKASHLTGFQHLKKSSTDVFLPRLDTLLK